jgi:hypothetical protein
MITVHTNCKPFSLIKLTVLYENRVTLLEAKTRLRLNQTAGKKCYAVCMRYDSDISIFKLLVGRYGHYINLVEAIINRGSF